MYQQAYWIALSYRMRRNELVILDNKIDIPEDKTGRYIENLLSGNRWSQGRTLLVTDTLMEENPGMFQTMETVGDHAELKDFEDVDVKDFLMGARVVIERTALLRVLCRARFFDKELDPPDLETAKSIVLGRQADYPQALPEQVVQYL
jgi:large subunit ribosomal protein L4